MLGTWTLEMAWVIQRSGVQMEEGYTLVREQIFKMHVLSHHTKDIPISEGMSLWVMQRTFIQLRSGTNR